MISQEAYKLKIEARMEPCLTKLTELKVEAKKQIAEVTAKYSRPIEELDEMQRATMVKLTELGNVNQDSWEALEPGVEEALNVFNTAIKGVAEKFGVEDTQHKPNANVDINMDTNTNKEVTLI